MGSKKQQKKNKTKKEEVDDEGGGGGGGGGRQDAAVSPFRNGGKVITDPRFASVHSDPRFQNVPTQRSKVVIDSRFDKMFSDKSFATSSAPSDKRGKPKPRHKTAKQKSDSNPLRRYYRIEDEEKEGEKSKGSDDEEDDSEEVEEERVKDRKRLKKLGDESSESEDSGEEEDDDDVESGDSEDSSDTGSEEEDGDDVYMEDEEDEDAVGVESVPVIEEETHRLAIVNMDWRHVRAVDLYVVLISFLPKGGQILSVSVYPSDFGLKRMEEEAVHGPIGLFDGDKGQDDEDNDDEIDEEKLRAYEQSKLRYYYAVVDCDSSATADHLYKGCDGVEFERSSNKLDLRFIPDSMEFKHPPRDVATEAPSTYEGLDFYTRELQQSKVNLTWDEDEPHRAKTLKRKFNADQLAELEFKEFLVSDDSENEEDENDEAIEVQSDKKHKKRDMYRALLLSGDGSDDNDDDGGQDMEVTFNTGLEDLSKRILEKKDKKSETVWDAYLRKKSEKKKARKSRTKHSSDDESSDTDEEAMEQPDDFFIEEPSAKRGKETQGKSDRKEKQHQELDKEAEASRAELELLLADDTGTNANVKGYNLKPKRDKGRKKKQVLDEEKLPTTDYDDPRFSALFNSHHFALDPTDPQFKRSAAYARQLAQKQHKGDIEERGHKKLPTDSQLPSDDSEMNKNEKVKFDVMTSNKEKHELSSMLKSIKMKSKQVQQPSGGNYLKR